MNKEEVQKQIEELQGRARIIISKGMMLTSTELNELDALLRTVEDLQKQLEEKDGIKQEGN